MARVFRSASAARRAAEAATQRNRRRLYISKKMTYSLRHDIEAAVGEDGFLPVDDLSQLCRVTTNEICEVAEEWSRDEQGNRRFEMTEREDGSFWIRATWGHTIEVDKRRIYSPPHGITGNRTENHKRACQRLKASRSEPRRSPTAEENPCVICLAETRTHAVIPCGHRCLCTQCALTIGSGSTTCPLCQSRFDLIVQIFD